MKVNNGASQVHQPPQSDSNVTVDKHLTSHSGSVVPEIDSTLDSVDNSQCSVNVEDHNVPLR